MRSNRWFLGIAVGLALAAQSFAATLSPITLLNPSGSTSGQAIVSNGPSSAPGWGTVVAGSLSPVAANTVIANPTGSTAAPVAHAVPSCSTANSALKWTSGTGLSCGTTFALTSGNLSQFASTTSAQLAGVLSDETGSGAAVFGTSPTIASPTLSGTVAGTPTFSGAVAFSSTITPSQTAGIVGTTTNNNANAGSFGEYVTNTTSGTSLTSGVYANATSTSLAAGDWDVECSGSFTAAGGAAPTLLVISVSSTSAAAGNFGEYAIQSINFNANSSQTFGTPSSRKSLASTTTVYCTAQAGFAGGTVTVNGLIRARRIR